MYSVNIVNFARISMIRAALFIFFTAIIAISCSTGKKTTVPKEAVLKSLFDTSTVFSKSLTGFILIDAQTGKSLFGRNQDHYFTPASNTKILTLALSLKLLKDTLAGLKVAESGDSVYFEGTGDPTFLHPSFEVWQPAFHFLKKLPATQKLVLYKGDFPEARFGPGWAWDDFQDNYQPEKSKLPVYGNVITTGFRPPDEFSPVRTAQINPAYFTDSISTEEGSRFIRDEHHNIWYRDHFPPSGERQVPFMTTNIEPLLSDTLGRPVSVTDIDLSHLPWRTINSVPRDTVLRLMMYDSDNFLAEQLLIQASQNATHTMRQDTLIKMAIQSIFTTSATPPRWVDGSGLSRYNLITPDYMAQVLFQLYRSVPEQKLFSYFPAGGMSGTIANLYGNPAGAPYVFAKTGSMSGVYCLSGYILTKSGKVLIFSCLNNNFVGSNRPWKTSIQQLLRVIHENF